MVASSASMASLERFHPYRRAGPSTWCGAADSSAFEPLERGRSCYVITSYCPYSPKCVEEEFCEVELPLYGVLGSSLSSGAARGCLRILQKAPEDGIRDAPLEAPQRFLSGLALSELLAVVSPASGVGPCLAYGDHVQGVVEVSVAGHR